MCSVSPPSARRAPPARAAAHHPGVATTVPATGTVIVVGGLPGVGKTTVARALAGLLRAAHRRIDAFETALLRQGLVPDPADVGPHGYALALAAADTCLTAGTDVVLDAVFPVAAARRPVRDLAAGHGAPVHWLRLICSDPAEHRRRVEQRTADLPGHAVPDWAAVRRRDVDQWHERHTVVDTAGGDPLTAALAAVGATDRRPPGARSR